MKPQDEKNPPFIFLIFFFFADFWRKMSVFSRFFGQKSPLGPFHEYPPGPTGVPYRFKPKKWSKMTKKNFVPPKWGFQHTVRQTDINRELREITEGESLPPYIQS